MYAASVTGPFRVASFRGLITALAVLALFAGFASAQIANSNAGQGPFQCSASVAVPPVLRAEGLTGLVGDIVLTCMGGTVVAPGTNLNTMAANVTVSFFTNVTSRLLTNSFSGTTNPLEAGNTNEALLLIDEPQSPDAGNSPGFGPYAPQILCGASGLPNSSVGAGAGGCPEFVELSSGFNVMTNKVVATPNPATDIGANVFVGVWGGSAAPNQVTFFGIPIMPPTSAGSERVYRITNIRVDTNAIAVSGGTGLVFAWISISGPTSVPVNIPVQITGFTQSGLTFQVRTPDNSAVLTAPSFSGCSVDTFCPYGKLRFTENFGDAFKTRVAPSGTTNGQSANPILFQGMGQNIPGTIYNSESGFIFSGITGTSGNAVAGLADFGTRLKAEFSNIPPGVRIFVATSNIANLVAPPAGNSTTSFAQLVTPETAVDGDGSIPSVSSAGPIAWNGTPALYGYAEIPAVSGSASAVWEVVNTNPPVNENFDFPVWILYGSGVTPAAMTIAGTLAPNSDNGAFSASGGTTAQDATYPMPRFTSVPPVPATLTVSPNQAANTGNVSVIMNLNEYLPLFAYGTPQVILFPDIPGTIQSTTYGMFPVAATFNLAGAQPGPRDVVFLSGGSYLASFPGAFTVLAAPPCTFQLGASSASVGVGSGGGQVVVSASSPSCTWGAVSDSPSWLGASSAPFSPILNYSVQANPGPGQRIGHIQVGGAAGPVLTVTQAGTATCTYAINPASQAFPSSGGAGSISVTAASGCQWSVTGIPTWVNPFSGSPGSGNGTFNYTVTLNSGGPRTATLTVADKTFALSQGGSACGTAVDVTSQVAVTQTALASVAPQFQTFSRTVKLTNTGANTIAGPIQFIMDGLPRSNAPCPTGAVCTVQTPAFTITYCQSTAGSEMVLMSSGGLAPGQSVSKTLTFTPGAANGGSAAAFQYTPRVLSGTP